MKQRFENLAPGTAAGLAESRVRTGADTVRLFLALWPAPELQHALHAWCAPWLAQGESAPVPRERLHMTLHFLGAVPRERLAALWPMLQVARTDFELALSRFDRWPRGLLVSPPDRVPQALLDLHRSLGVALREAGITPESRPFRPHLTLARRCTGGLPPPLAAPLHWPVRSYALVESRSAPQRSYEVLQTYS